MKARLRPGTLLPALLVPLAIVALLGIATTSSAIASHRDAHLAEQGVTTLARAESALETARARFSISTPTSAAPLPLPLPGTVDTIHVAAGNAPPVLVTIARPHPLMLWLTADAPAAPSRGLPAMRRRVTRALWLAHPAIPVAAAVSMASADGLHPDATLDGTDADRGTPPCGPPRVPGHLPALRVADRLELDTASLRQPLQRLGRWHHPQLPPLPPAGAWEGVALAPPTTPLTGQARWRGLLVVNGDLAIDGALEVDGVLVVLGRLDVRGTLQVRGALLLAGGQRRRSHLGAGTTVRYSRCAVQLALAAIAEPRTGPVGHWGVGTP